MAAAAAYLSFWDKRRRRRRNPLSPPPSFLPSCGGLLFLCLSLQMAGYIGGKKGVQEMGFMEFDLTNIFCRSEIKMFVFQNIVRGIWGGNWRSEKFLVVLLHETELPVREMIGWNVWGGYTLTKGRTDGLLLLPAALAGWSVSFFERGGEVFLPLGPCWWTNLV